MIRIVSIALQVAVLFSLGNANVWAITVQDFVHDTVMSSPEVNEQIHIFRQAYQDEKIANSGWLPSLDLSLITGNVDEKRPSDSNYDSSEAELTLTQNLFDGFDTTNQINQARSRIASAVYRLYDTADNAALDAVSAYNNVLSANELVKLAEKNVRSHEQTLDQLIEKHFTNTCLACDYKTTRLVTTTCLPLTSLLGFPRTIVSR